MKLTKSLGIDDLKIRTKLAAAFFLITAITVISSLSGMYSSKTIGQGGITVGQKLAPLAERIGPRPEEVAVPLREDEFPEKTMSNAFRR